MKSTQVPDRETLNKIQAEKFSEPRIINEFLKPLPPEIEQRLKRVVDAMPELSSSSRIIDIGSGTGCLIPHLRARGVKDILAVDVSEKMLESLSARFPAPSDLGNDVGVRTWHGDVMDLPAFLGPADGFFFNSCFGNLHSPRDALLKAALMLKPGSSIVISHPMGRAWHMQLHTEDVFMVPHPLPDKAGLEAMVHDLPLRITEFVDEPECYYAVLQVPAHYEVCGQPVTLAGPVVRGAGRGSKQMGVPTANIDPAGLEGVLSELPNGVYFGWAQLDAPSGWSDADRAVHKVVLNIGRRPTIEDHNELTIECHILHSYPDDFYGQPLKVKIVGFIRPEMRFPGLDALVGRIKADIAIARIQLDSGAFDSPSQL